MICEKCNKNIANVYLKNNINGNITENYLCSSCAGQIYGQNYMNLFDNNNLSFDFDSDIFNMLGLNKNPSQSVLTETAKNNKCLMCGSSFYDITQSGKAGCGKCYETFRNEFEPNVTRIHGTAKHTGKIPGNMSAKLTAKRKIEELNIKLKKMIADQNFEEAAVIRDEIKKININTDSQGV